MQINTALKKATTKRDRRFQCRVRRFRFSLRDYILKHPVKGCDGFECHSMSWAVSLVVPELHLVNGAYIGLQWSRRSGKNTCKLRECYHSWLVTPDGAILDLYPVGFMTIDAVLVPTRGVYKHYGGGLYRQDDSIKKKLPWRKIRKRSLFLAKLIRKAEKAWDAKKE